MAELASLRVQNLRETIRAFSAAPREVARAAKAELGRVGSSVAADMRRRAPSATDPNKRGRRHRALAASVTTKTLARGVLVGSPAFHAPIIEFGRKATQRSRAGTVYTRRLTPQPWAYPSVDARREDVRDSLEGALQRSLDIVFRGVAV